jgi:4-hydroxy-3-methylbut-2-enyl diphosphate reductase
MEVIRARVLGYCMGVRRAVDLASRESASPADRVYTLGPLIHNPQVLEMLKKRGVEILDEADIPGDLRGAAVIIRAHGVSPALEAEVRARGARLTDATCPRVKASQMKARSLYEEGYRLFLAGERLHGEIIGIQGYAPGCAVVADPEEAARTAERLRRDAGPGIKTALIGQTTISPEEYRAIGDAISRFFPNLTVIDTICGATRDRQEALRELCGDAEVIIVAGGEASANTRRLLAIARSRGKLAWLTESAADIPPEIAAYRTVGLSAGASTPDEVIGEIERALRTR